MKLLLVGATGLVGGQVLALALADPRIHAVVTPTRRDLPAHPKLLSPRVDFDHLPEDADWWQADAVICTLGTTMRAAGSRDAFRRVDHQYPLDVARITRRHGTPTYVLNSAMGASASSKIFYNRVKGELEQDLAKAGFQSLTFVRPGLIGGERDALRMGEHTMLVVLGLLGPVLPRRWRINPAAKIASALIEAAVEPPRGVSVVASAQLA